MWGGLETAEWGKDCERMRCFFVCHVRLFAYSLIGGKRSLVGKERRNRGPPTVSKGVLESVGSDCVCKHKILGKMTFIEFMDGTKA
ncbi:unnamed protein product [Protopolystoma xenopodis]|uniref:Uncharacterized protein n=1 Tax=Protopolystoma xenopodis TaxID=117903 RepID=A0A448X041_9PLAT|nr:unnamed protein product [Protopolystoma xenopodis]